MKESAELVEFAEDQIECGYKLKKEAKDDKEKKDIEHKIKNWTDKKQKCKKFQKSCSKKIAKKV